MAWTPDHLSVKGALASFHQALEAGETAWDKHSQTISSTTDTEALVFPGFLPAPREFLDSRQFQGARDFRYNVPNKEYELSMVVTRKNWEDDQTGLINARFSEMGEVWRTYKDSLFTLLLANGNVAGNVGWDGVVFHGDSRTIGDSGTIDNNLTDTTLVGTTATVAELLIVLATIRQQFHSFKDDQGRPFNAQANSRIRMLAHPAQERAAYEALNQTAFTGGSGASNVFGPKFLEGVDILPYMVSGDLDEMYFSALGSVRKPFIYQERTSLEIVMLASGDEVVKNNGVMALTRQRFTLTYGEPRRSVLMTVS